jgi:hypothetical protein
MPFAFLIAEEIATADDQPVAAWLVEMSATADSSSGELNR